MGYNPHTLPIDFVIVRGLPTPGVGTIQRAKRTIKVDEIGGYGVSGSVLVVHGRRLVPFDIVIKLTTPEDWAEWDNFKSVVLTMPSGINAKALDVWHPWLVMLEVKSAIVTDVSQPEDDGTGVFTITISMIEFRRPKLTLASPVAAEQKPASTDPVDKYIEQLTNQVQELAK
jgi:hypothetical protein